MPPRSAGRRDRAATPDPRPGPAVEQAVAEMARQVQALTAALAARPAELETRVAILEVEAALLRAEREQLLRLKTLYERKFEAMRAGAPSDGLL